MGRFFRVRKEHNGEIRLAYGYHPWVKVVKCRVSVKIEACVFESQEGWPLFSSAQKKFFDGPVQGWLGCEVQGCQWITISVKDRGLVYLLGLGLGSSSSHLLVDYLLCVVLWHFGGKELGEINVLTDKALRCPSWLSNLDSHTLFWEVFSHG